MLYQKMLVGENPYMIAVGDAFSTGFTATGRSS